MSANSSIEWTETTWNPVTGCTKVSPGCQHCYAERMAKRLQAMGHPNYKNGFELTTHDHSLEIPFSIRKPKLIFVNSMSDLFHENIPISFINEVFSVMNKASWHTFQVLTKRADILLKLAPTLKWTPNIWMGVSVENEKYSNRIDFLKQTPAVIKFISFEPLLGPIMYHAFSGIDWVIVGGESGPGARKLEKYWVINIKQKCEYNSIPFFFKQWGGVRKKLAGRLLDGIIWNQYPSEFAQ